MLSQMAKKSPERTCLKYLGSRYSYSDVERLVSLASGGIASFGLKQKDRIAILMDNSPEYIISYFAILRAGCIAVPVNTFLTPEEVSYIINNSSARLLIYSDSFIAHVNEITKKVESLMVAAFNEIPQLDGDIQPVDDDEVAVLLYTSGTTGFPKGAMLTHRNLISNAEACMKFMRVTKRDKILLFLPLVHSFSFTVCVLLPILAGAGIVLLPSIKPFSRVMKSVFKDRVTFFVAVPTIYSILSRKRIPLLLKYIIRFFTNIRACISGAAALPGKTLDAFERAFGVPLIEGYGLTEASPVVAVNPLKGVRKPSSVGTPLPGIHVDVVGEGGGKLPAGETGELIVKGPNVMKGYFNNKAETDKVIRDGWLYTGDMARIDDDGYIYIVDRKKDLIVVNGINIYPREVEDTIDKHTLVEGSAMVGVSDGRGSETTVLFVKKKADVSLDSNELMEHMKGRIARFKMPRKIIFVDEFPRTATGKIKKNELRMWKP
jgi:long-chain acyl-CoA synthetase